MGEAATVILVEDDADQARLYSTWLVDGGYRVETCTGASEFRRRLGDSGAALALFDCRLPDGDCIGLARWVRESVHAKLPVIMLTACADETDIVAGLHAGADDYVVKPPRRDELLARIGALLRRSAPEPVQGIIADIEPYAIDTLRRACHVGGVAIDLTDREFDLAAYLFRRAGQVVSREALLRDVWKLNAEVNTRTVDTHVSRLRRKSGLGGEHGWRLVSVYQHGYRLERC